MPLYTVVACLRDERVDDNALGAKDFKLSLAYIDASSETTARLALLHTAKEQFPAYRPHHALAVPVPDKVANPRTPYFAAGVMLVKPFTASAECILHIVFSPGLAPREALAASLLYSKVKFPDLGLLHAAQHEVPLQEAVRQYLARQAEAGKNTDTGLNLISKLPMLSSAIH
jgi:hypothetical protein